MRLIPVFPIILLYPMMAAMPLDLFFELAPSFSSGSSFALVAGGITSWNFGATVSRGELPWHDRWAGTEVIR